MLQWARDHGCPWDAGTCIAAASAQQWALLKWARQQGCPYHEWACAAAAQGSYMTDLQKARRNGGRVARVSREVHMAVSQCLAFHASMQAP